MEAKEIMERAGFAFPGDEEMLTWLKALTSGEYKQCKAKLSDGEGFCCLGVMGRVVLKERLRDITTSKSVEEDYKRPHIKSTYSRAEEFLNNRGLNTNDYIDMNDEGRPFLEIAAHIVLDKEFDKLMKTARLNPEFSMNDEDGWAEAFFVDPDIKTKLETLARFEKSIDKEGAH